MTAQRLVLDEQDLGQTSYHDFLDSIRHSMDPNSNSVLLVDDEKSIRMKVARDVRLSDPKLAIYQASNGREALEQLVLIRAKHVHDPLLIVLDLNMPVMDGWAVIDALKKEYEAAGRKSGIPIVVLSSTTGEKGGLFRKTSVHEGKSGYTPLVAIAKESCVDNRRYDAAGEQGLMAWLKHFVKQA
ncbi:MAG: hypothetical protein A2498_08940 [Lentisphaerae bacterium RIFOXYC12_FULL_60_16]|nr:MAG: hypothetical protein A2498_08940 [Lentisphaerae bacterium RIFOXYC12_FULL_60_16]OGV81047.1 MAG: hypothetical protein A2340_07305 [Lentisphaerae bacterium RIFOXYB12_FULL_60_10]